MKRSSKRVKNVVRAKKSRSVMARRQLRLLEGEVLGVIAFLIIGIFGLTSIGGIIIHGNEEASVEAAVLIDLTNQNREANGLGDLTVSPLLTEAAQEKANDEAAKGYFAHTSPQGLDSWYWFQQAGYKFLYAGENLAVNFTDSSAVMTAWMNSPDHRANILDVHYTQIGIATAEGMYEGEPTIFVVQEFGTPAATASQQPIAQQTQPAQPTQIAQASIRSAATGTPQVLATESRSTPKSTPAPTATKPATVASVPTKPVAIALPSPTIAGSTVRYASFWDFYLASPQVVLRYAYYAISILVLVALFLTVGVELERKHMRSFAAAAVLFVMMGGLFFVANAYVFGTPAVAESVSPSAP